MINEDKYSLKNDYGVLFEYYDDDTNNLEYSIQFCTIRDGNGSDSWFCENKLMLWLPPGSLDMTDPVNQIFHNDPDDFVLDQVVNTPSNWEAAY